MWVRVVLQRSVPGSVLAGAQGGVQAIQAENEEKTRSRLTIHKPTDVTPAP